MEDEKIELYNPTEKDIASRKWAYDGFRVMWDNSRRTYTQFCDKTLTQYLDESRKMLNLMSKPREDGRSNIKSTTPLNKLMAILARIALNRPSIQVSATSPYGNLDKKRGDILKDLYKHSYERLDNEFSADSDYFFRAFDCASDGVMVTYEGFDSQTHTKKKIISYDPDSGEVEFEEEDFKTNNCFNVQIRPEDFFVWNPYIRSLQRQPKIAWRTIYDEDHFKEEFQGYKKAKYVKAGVSITENLADSYYKKYWQDRLYDKQVEVLRVFSKAEKRMVIVANGVVLLDSPFPWMHAKYPFSYTIFAPFAGGEFFWGMSFAFKLKGDVAALETLYNLGIEQAKLSVNPPQLTTTENEIENNSLLPGRILEVDNIDNFRELQFKSPDASYFNFIEIIGKNLDLASVDPVSQGMNIKGSTARGQVIAEENARKLLGIFNLMMENLVLQEAKLRIPNIVQFMLIPGTTYRMENANVNGQQGVREIKVIGDRQEAETPSQLEMIETMAEMQGITLERLNITPAYLQNAEWSIKVLSDSSYQQGKSLRIALETEKIGQVAQLFPNIFQSASELFFKDLMEVYDSNPEKYLDAAKQATSQNAMQMLMQNQGEMKKQGMMGEITGNDATLPKLSGVES